MNIELHIERLVLDGLPVQPHERARVRAAVEAELARLLTNGDLRNEIASGGALPSLPVSTFHIARLARPQMIGEQIAGAVYQQLGQIRE